MAEQIKFEKWQIENLQTAMNAQILSDVKKEFCGFATDSRESLNQKIFFALKGDAHDAHDFLEQAVNNGAAALVIHDQSKVNPSLLAKCSVLLVQNTLTGLQDFARWHRQKMNCKIVAITGSNGKTTSKEFTAQILSHYKNTHYSKGSFNNHWGVPFTLLQINKSHDVAVVEQGMNHAGELTELNKISLPDIVVCSTVGKAHVEHFGTVENIALAKKEIYDSASEEAIRIFNLDNPHTLKMYQENVKKFAHNKILTFSSQGSIQQSLAVQTEVNVQLSIVEATMTHLKIKGKIGHLASECKVEVFGVQNLTNLMVASSVALACGLSPEQIWMALPHCKTSWGRNQHIQLRSGAQMIFDGYNANPDSMRALIENITLIKAHGKKIGVFAEMLEMGPQAQELHFQLGQQVGQSSFDYVWFYGPSSTHFAEGVKSAGYKNTLMISNTYEDSLASKIQSVLKDGDIVLVKGSRGMKLERFVLMCDPVNFEIKK